MSNPYFYLDFIERLHESISFPTQQLRSLNVPAEIFKSAEGAITRFPDLAKLPVISPSEIAPYSGDLLFNASRVVQQYKFNQKKLYSAFDIAAKNSALIEGFPVATISNAVQHAISVEPILSAFDLPRVKTSLLDSIRLIEPLNINEISKTLSSKLSLPPVFTLAPIADAVKHQMVDNFTGSFTPQFDLFTEQVAALSPSDFLYEEIDDENVELSPSMTNLVDDFIPEEKSIHRSSLAPRQVWKQFVAVVLLPLLIAAVQTSCSEYSNRRAAQVQEQYHQEEMEKYDQILKEEQQQTEYLRKIAESSVD